VIRASWIDQNLKWDVSLCTFVKTRTLILTDSTSDFEDFAFGLRTLFENNFVWNTCSLHITNCEMNKRKASHYELPCRVPCLIGSARLNWSCQICSTTSRRVRVRFGSGSALITRWPDQINTEDHLIMMPRHICDENCKKCYEFFVFNDNHQLLGQVIGKIGFR
jgi:hypothetical protein